MQGRLLFVSHIPVRLPAEKFYHQEKTVDEYEDTLNGHVRMSAPRMIDTHTHLCDPVFDDDRDEVLITEGLDAYVGGKRSDALLRV